MIEYEAIALLIAFAVIIVASEIRVIWNQFKNKKDGNKK
ncbi:hypothetical protein AKUG0406_PHAGE200090 (plasmid) [Apilactobacillus kunkeei]|nr:hypothetical protein AKUG0406_PHAGE200090 [Apilactobacillus kunkeei]CAI2676506.1 hypothetical protein AKUG0403_PHAGE200090 [Apilactobacillus kunkeei]